MQQKNHTKAQRHGWVPACKNLLLLLLNKETIITHIKNCAPVPLCAIKIHTEAQRHGKHLSKYYLPTFL